MRRVCAGWLASLVCCFSFVPYSAVYAEAPGGRSKSGADAERPYGIETRVPWTGSKITGSPEPPLPYKTERVFPKLQFVNPVELVSLPGTDRLIVVELTGKVYSFENKSDAADPELVIDLGREIPGMTRAYAMTFHPDFAENRYCYLSYILEAEDPVGTRLSRFVMTQTDPPRIDPASEEILLRWKSGGHNGGALQFGPEGYLYVSTGDGGPAFPPDPLKSGQDVGNLLASILRIDVDHAGEDRPYSIPGDNPFVNLEGARGEVWAYGFRNPWKMSFDPATGELWVGDVGWELWEMVYNVRKGGNYGWSLVEGPQPVHEEGKRGPTPILPPTALHSHIEARSITGGFVYHGRRLPELQGAYIYGDYVTGKVWGIRHDGEEMTWQQELVDAPIQIICFGLDHQQELYLMGYGGTIHQLVRNPRAEANLDFPKTLSETGLFASVKDHRPAPGVIPYSVNAELWEDGATAERFVALPGRTQLGVYQESNAQIGFLKGMWAFPTDGVLARTVSLELTAGDPSSRRRLETQVLHFDGEMWRAYNYIWNDEQTEAHLAENRATERSFTIRDPQAPGGTRRQTWHFASRNECILCHTTRSGTVQGFNPRQLNGEHDYGRVSDNQLRTLAHIDLFAEPLTKRQQEVIPAPDDPAVDLEQRARAYLHVNCAHCHRRGGGGTAAIELLYEHSMKKTNLLDARPTQGTFGIHAAQVLAPGDPYRSVLYYRMAKLGRGRMPYFGSQRIDEAGLKLIHDWITSLGSEIEDESAARLRERGFAAVETLKSQQEFSAETVDRLVSTTSGALVLLRAIDDGAFGAEREQKIIRRALESEDIQVRDLFERFLPEEERTKRLGTEIKPEELLALEGNAVRGRQVFAEAAGVQCRNCHKLGDVGKELGPDLIESVKKLKHDRAKILESILQPSKTVEQKYVSYIVETSAGRVYTGLLANPTPQNPQEVVLVDAAGKEIRIPADEVELMVQQRKSIMPELLLRDMTAQQVADLLEYLTRLE